MQIDPNIKGYINGAVAICGVIATLGVSVFPDYVPSGIAKDVVQTAGWIFMIYGGVNSGANFLSSNKPGLLAPPSPPPVVAAQKVADLTAADASPVAIQTAKAQAVQAINSH